MFLVLLSAQHIVERAMEIWKFEEWEMEREKYDKKQYFLFMCLEM